jgi:hypothetical protein
MSTLAVNSIVPANAGSESFWLCKVWVDFIGSGTPTIQGSGNVSSLTDVSTGYYYVNFDSSLPSVNYSTLSTAADSAGNPSDTHSAASSYSTSVIRTRQYSSGTAARDAGQVSCAAIQ